MIYGLYIFLLLTVGVLVLGLIGFARNSESYQKNANKLMRLRILFQFFALIFALLFIAFAGGR